MWHDSSLSYDKVSYLNATRPQYSHSQARYGHGSSKVGFQNMKTRKYQSGEIIIQEGETSRDLFVLTRGVAEASRTIEGKTIILGEIKPPQVFGESTFFTGFPRTATVSAKTKVEAAVFGYEALKDQIAELPTWVKRTLETLTNRIESCDKRIVELEGEVLELKGK